MNWEEWNGIIHDWTTKHTTAEVVALAAELRIPVAPVSDGPAVADLRAGGRARLPGRRPDRHVPGAAPTVADRRRGVAAAATRARAWASTPARSCPVRRSRPRPASAELPLARRQGRSTSPRGGRARRRRRCSPRSAPTSSTWSRSPGPTACATPAASAWIVTTGGSTSALFHTSNTNKRDLTLDLARPEGRDARAAPDRAGRPRGRELHAARDRAVRSRLGRRARHQPACGDGAHARVRPRRSVARPPGLRADHGAGHRAGVAHRSRRRPTADPARPVRPERRHARGRGRARRARAARPHRRRLAGRVDHVRGRAQHLGRAHRRVDEVRQRARRARGAAARGPRRRACTPPTRRSGGSWSRWRPTSSGRRWSTRSGGPTGRPIPSCAPTRAAAPHHDLLDEKLGAWAADTDLDKAVDLLVSARGPGRAGGRRPRARRSTRSTSPAATTSTPSTR